MSSKMGFPNKKDYLQGNLNFTLPCHLNYGKCFLDKILEYKDKDAMIDGVTGEKITFNEMARKIMRISTSLSQLGVKKGDVIGICSENRIEFIPTLIGVLCAGGVATFFNPSYSKDEIIHVAGLSRPKFVILSPNAYQTQYSTLESLNIIEQFFVYGSEKIRDVRLFSELDNESVSIENFEAVHFYGKSNRALILYSSGTTGVPKGANITHVNWITTIYQHPYTAKPLTMLSVAPFTNTMGCAVVVYELLHGKTVVFLSKFEEDFYLRTMARYKVGMIVVAPSILVILSKSTAVNKYDIRSLELLVSGGAPLESETITEFKKRFPNVQHVLQVYGMTEVLATISKENVNFHKQGSVGKLGTGAIVKIVDPKTKNILGPNQPGEVCVAGSVVFDGYIGVEQDIDDEGFFKTGDIAYYDEDGFLFIIDRVKELIKYKAWQVPPSELEALLLQHPCVEDAAVVGLPDKLAGELPTAFVVKKPDIVATENDIVEFVASKVSPWKRLRGGVRFVDDIPKNPSGKILRRILRQRLATPISKL